MLAWRKLQAGLKAVVKPQEASKQIIQTTVIQKVSADAATHYTKGIVRLATSAQVTTATDDSIAVSPKNLEDGFDGSSNIVTLGTVTAGNVDSVVSAASATLAGKIEIATTAETNTGTDATRAVSPDGLAGSNLGTVEIGVIAVDATTDLTVADGKAYIPIPAALNGMNLVRAQAMVITAGTTNATTIDIYNVTDSQDMLSTAISIASGATVGTVGTINTTYDDVATNDVLRVDVTTMSTTAPKGLLVVLEFRLP